MIASLGAAVSDTCGGKAATLARLLRHGFLVPEGFVVPFAVHRAAQVTTSRSMPVPPMPDGLVAVVGRQLAEMGDPPVAVRSSAGDEDTTDVSAAGQYETVLGVRGPSAVTEAIRTCWASLSAVRATRYQDGSRHDTTQDDPAMAVVVQRMVDADVSGVMFTPVHPEDGTRIEASYGLGPSLVGGTVTPDTYAVAAGGSIRCLIAEKATRLDRDGDGITARTVPEPARTSPTLDEAAVVDLTVLGRRIADVLGKPQDIEWAVADRQIWILQARPITASPPPLSPSVPVPRGISLLGTPGSHGTVTGAARILHGPDDFSRIRSGDILVCRYTDPAWTPLFQIVAGVVTEVGGVLSHAAIVAREHGIPAVLGAAGATTRIPDGAQIAVDGTIGTVTAQPGIS